MQRFYLIAAVASFATMSDLVLDPASAKPAPIRPSTVVHKPTIKLHPSVRPTTTTVPKPTPIKTQTPSNGQSNKTNAPGKLKSVNRDFWSDTKNSVSNTLPTPSSPTPPSLQQSIGRISDTGKQAGGVLSSSAKGLATDVKSLGSSLDYSARQAGKDAAKTVSHEGEKLGTTAKAVSSGGTSFGGSNAKISVDPVVHTVKKGASQASIQVDNAVQTTKSKASQASVQVDNAVKTTKSNAQTAGGQVASTGKTVGGQVASGAKTAADKGGPILSQVGQGILNGLLNGGSGGQDQSTGTGRGTGTGTATDNSDAGSGNGSGTSTGTGTGTDNPDDEDSKASKPVEVSGAFLTGNNRSATGSKLSLKNVARSQRPGQVQKN